MGGSAVSRYIALLAQSTFSSELFFFIYCRKHSGFLLLLFIFLLGEKIEIAP
jgi:hypothetical protein